MDERTTRDFRFKGDLWSIVNEWAQDNGYFISNLSPGATNRHWYKIDKWAGFLDSLHGRRELEISLNNENVRLEAWLIYGDEGEYTERSFESGGLFKRLHWAWWMGRKEINNLLQRLNQIAIH